MRVILHGILKNRIGESFEMEASSIADAIEGLSRQTDWPSDVPIRVVGHNDLQKLYTTCPDEIHLMPAMRGGSGRFFNIIIGAALIVAGVITGGLSTPLGASLIISGSMMVLQGVVALFQKQPTFNRNEDPEASKYLNPNRNTVAAGTPITLAYGEIDLAGHWVSIQSNSSNLSYGTFPATPT
jgi:predicted phage tail protein